MEAEGSKLQGHPLNIYIWKYDFTTISAAVNGKSGFKKKGFTSQSITEGKLSPQELETVIHITPINKNREMIQYMSNLS